MKKNFGWVFCLGLLFFSFRLSPGQQIDLSKDSLYFPEEFGYDSLVVRNIGNADLIIDSLFSVHEEYAYFLTIETKDTTIFYRIDGGHWPFFVTVDPGDSVLFIFSAPDLCSICKASSNQDYFEDSLLMCSNSIIGDSLLIFAYGQGYPSALPEKQGEQPQAFILEQNYPNPFNPVTTIRYRLFKKSYIRLSIYNVLGQIVQNLVSEVQKPGNYFVTWRADGLPGGLYYYRLEDGKGTGKTRKLILLK